MTEGESLVRALIDNFSVENLRRFLASKNRDFGLLATVQDLPQYADEEFSRVQELAEVTLDDGIELGVFVLQTAGEITERTSKKKQFDKARKILKEELLDAGLFVFYGGNGNFRFSLVYQTTRGKKTEFSPYKRYTFYVVRGRPNRTFVKSMVGLQLDSLEHLIDAFDAKPLTKEFYTEIQNWYAWALKHTKFPGGRNEENLIRLLSRLLFVWFLKERNLVPEEIFDQEFLDKVVKDFNGPNATNYYNAILQNLFFATLNRHANERRFAKDGTCCENRDEFGVKTLYRYQGLLKISEEEFVKIFEKVPMINGGLFECLDEDKEYIDGFSRNPQKRARVPDFLFFSEGELVDLIDFYGEGTPPLRVRGLINILKEYDFTADENTPIDVEVSLNPELLGHIFENLLAMYNPETSTTARKATGSYYTPQWVVDFIVDGTVVAYLKDRTGLGEELLRSLLTYDGQATELDKESRRRIVEAIDSLKVIDPAVGSGAFPMGIVHKLVHILSVVDPHNDIWFDMQLNRLKRRIEMTVKEGDEKSIAELEQEIEKVFNEALYYPDYARKLYLIENSIYGVDIQPIAIQLCKLRFFLSLLVDQKVDWSKPEENYGIRPLPHLETKFVAADALVYLWTTGQMVFISDDVRRLMNRLKELYHRHFLVKNRSDKIELQQEATKVRQRLRTTLLAEGWPGDVADKIASVDIFSQTRHSDWFDPEWMLGVEDGFDIVIGNPPYGDILDSDSLLMGRKPYQREHVRKHYKYSSASDAASPFLERSIGLLKQGGVLSFIITFAITFNKYFSGNRVQIANEFKRSDIITFDRDKCHIFENMTQSVSILKCVGKSLGPGEGIFTSRFYRSIPDLREIHLTSASGFILPFGSSLKAKQPNRLPKIGDAEPLLEKLWKLRTDFGPLGKYLLEDANVWYRTSGNYWYNAWDWKPYTSSEVKELPVKGQLRDFLILLLNSSLFYTWMRIYGDGRHLNDDLLEDFPAPDESVVMANRGILEWARRRLMERLRSVFDSKLRRFETSKAKREIDVADFILCTLVYQLGFELFEYVATYDSEVRGGLALTSNELDLLRSGERNQSMIDEILRQILGN